MDIAKMINDLPAGGSLVVPGGEYIVPVDTIKLKSGQTIDLRGATLTALPNNKEKYSIIMIDEADNVSIKGGTIIGDRKAHEGTTGEWGMGIWFKRCKIVTVTGTTVKNCWGDGFYMGGKAGPSNVIMNQCMSIGNRRQGLSIVEARDIIVNECLFADTRGTAPQAGIDIEPDKDSAGVHGVDIVKCRFERNANYGLIINGKKAVVERITVRGCTFKDNKSGTIKSNTFTWYQNLMQDLRLWTPTSVIV